MIIIVMVLLYKPVKKTLDARSNAIESEISNAKQNNIESQKNLTESEQSIVDARKKANEIIEDANQKAYLEAKKIIESAEKEIEQMKVDANEDIERSKQQSLQEIHDEMVDVALSASKEILQRETIINKSTGKVEEKEFSLDGQEMVPEPKKKTPLVNLWKNKNR